MIACAQKPMYISTKSVFYMNITSWHSRCRGYPMTHTGCIFSDSSETISMFKHFSHLLEPLQAALVKQTPQERHHPALPPFVFANGNESNFSTLLIEWIYTLELAQTSACIAQGSKKAGKFWLEILMQGWELGIIHLESQRLPGGDVIHFCLLEKLLSPIVLK